MWDEDLVSVAEEIKGCLEHAHMRLDAGDDDLLACAVLDRLAKVRESLFWLSLHLLCKTKAESAGIGDGWYICLL